MTERESRITGMRVRQGKKESKVCSCVRQKESGRKVKYVTDWDRRTRIHTHEKDVRKSCLTSVFAVIGVSDAEGMKWIPDQRARSDGVSNVEGMK